MTFWVEENIVAQQDHLGDVLRLDHTDLQRHFMHSIPPVHLMRSH